jgi:hypothetical protein
MYGNLPQLYAWLVLFWQVGDWDPCRFLVPRAYDQIRVGTAFDDAERLLGVPVLEPDSYTLLLIPPISSFGRTGSAVWETRFYTVWVEVYVGKVRDKRLRLNSAGVDARRQLINIRSSLGSILTPFLRFVPLVECTVQAFAST